MQIRRQSFACAGDAVMYKQLVNNISSAGEKIGAVTTFTVASASCAGANMLHGSFHSAGVFGFVTFGSAMYGMVELENIKSLVAMLPENETVAMLCGKMVGNSIRAGMYGIGTGLGLGLGAFGIMEGSGFPGAAFLAIATVSTSRYFKHKISSDSTSDTLLQVLWHRRRP